MLKKQRQPVFLTAIWTISHNRNQVIFGSLEAEIEKDNTVRVIV
jgi:hypothetical protein